jgi:hypothetical protein
VRSSIFLKSEFFTVQWVPAEDHAERIAALEGGRADAYTSERGILVASRRPAGGDLKRRLARMTGTRERGGTMRVRVRASGWLGAWLCVAAVLDAGLAHAQSAPDARALLVKMGEFIGNTPRLSVTIRSSYDTVQTSGDKIEWNEVRRLTLSRQDRLRIETEKSNGARTLILFDGKTISVYDEAGRAYSQTPQPGGIDETLVYFVRDLGMRLPLAVFFVSRAGMVLDRRVRSVEYVEKTGILGIPAHHLVGRTDTVNFQIWIADGDQPLPQRLVLTYPKAPGQPEFRAQFVDWNLAPDVADSLFAFAPPAGANRIPFAAALAQAGRATTGASGKKGAKP